MSDLQNKVSVRRIMRDVIANADSPAAMKLMITTAYESQLISVCEAFALIQVNGLEAA